MESGAALLRVLPGLSRFFQDLERGDRGWKHCHVTAGRADDFSYRGAGRRLHAVATTRATSGGAGDRLRDGRSPECSRTWRIVAFDLSARDGLAEALCLPPFFADPSRTFGGFAD